LVNVVLRKREESGGRKFFGLRKRMPPHGPQREMRFFLIKTYIVQKKGLNRNPIDSKRGKRRTSAFSGIDVRQRGGKSIVISYSLGHHRKKSFPLLFLERKQTSGK